MLGARWLQFGGTRFFAFVDFLDDHPLCRWLGWLIGFLAACLAPIAVQGADLTEARRLFQRGEYEACRNVAAQAIEKREYGEGWPVLKARVELYTGCAKDAAETCRAGLERYSSSIQLRLLGHHAAGCCGEFDEAGKLLREVDEAGRKSPWRYTDADDLLALGEAALILGADPKFVLETFFDRARTQFPNKREPHVAVGQLALDKQDFALAAEVFQVAAKKFADDSEITFGLARAFAESAPLRSEAELEKTLKLNPRLVPALLMRVDRCLDAERYDQADAWLRKVEETNPREPDLWAFRAVLAHLRNDPRGETLFRDAGGADENPGVDHLIGRKLSQKYRFAEGAAAQRRALETDPDFIPAKVQLAQDLLRLGEEDEGWALAEEAGNQDGYHVANFNLLELKDRIAKFTTLENDDFVLRMETKEAAVYGQRVLDLLGRAKRTLCEKYDLDLTHRVTVEIFPDENDFAVRTFGLPVGSGYLGVCFGRVITANSPASQKEHPANWEAVLWHEFCHVVTLESTANRMPRWLSEGISVYEESRENPAWGQRMNPRFRRMILGGELTPVRDLSAAFLHAKDGVALQFAYYESSLVVEFLIDRHGIDALKEVLSDLKRGISINDALDRRTDGLARLETEFAAFARRRAEEFAPDADWSDPKGFLASVETKTDEAKSDPTKVDDSKANDPKVDNPKSDFVKPETLERWLADHPHNVGALLLLARLRIEAEEFDAARKPLETLIRLDPAQTGGGNAYELLAEVHHKRRDVAAERRVLEQYVERDCAALAACRRLLELQAEARDWPAVLMTADRAAAINPLIPQIQRSALDAGEAVGRSDVALAAARALLVLSPEEKSSTHYRIAKLLHQKNDPEAKRHVLQALEEAPRFRAAQNLLLEIRRQ